ncbi:MAG: hypothetical protein Ct9H300mP24_5660 [Candidatus Neomarinimicrobiota bacterium]|nr:MAG: hypothetical protein Ct9H300mP24_5660 [Candidatus Neomarinimicrobiota bacterium]
MTNLVFSLMLPKFGTPPHGGIAFGFDRLFYVVMWSEQH